MINNDTVNVGGVTWKSIPRRHTGMEFHCPGCNQQALVKVSTVVETSHMHCDKSGLCSAWDSKDSQVVSTVYKCPWCGREMTREEVEACVTHVDTGSTEPHIRIKYSLCTDGDYHLKNHRMYGAIQDENDEDYEGEVCFTGDIYRAARSAVDFLWCMLCDGLHFSWSHPWLVRDFYDMFQRLHDSLWEWITASEKDPKAIPMDSMHLEDYVSGNYDGTEFTITCYGYGGDVVDEDRCEHDGQE